METPTTMPDQHLKTQGGALKRTLQTFLDSIANPTADDVVRGLEQTVQPRDQYRCMNPVCAKMCAWPSGYAAGRPTRFCGRSCRRTFDRERARLARELKDLESWLERDDLLSRHRQDIERAVGQRRWALVRYPANQEEQAGGPS